MTFPAQDLVQIDEKSFVLNRARLYIIVRLAVDVAALVLLLLHAITTREALIIGVMLIDIAGLAFYRMSVGRWPTASTYLQLIFATILLVVFDFVWGSITFIPWFLTIPLSIAGGLIVTRAGFNSLVTLSILAIFGVYVGLIAAGRIQLPMNFQREQLLLLSAALTVALLVINALIESLVVYMYQTEESLLQTRAQLLYTLQELEQNRNLLNQVQSQTRRMERLSTVGQIAEQLSRSLRGPLEEIERILRSPDDILQQPQTIRALHNQVEAALRMTEGLKEYAGLTELHIKTVNLDDILAQELTHIRIPETIKLSIKQPPVFPPIQADPEKVRMLIHHLLHNALKAVETGGEVHIALTPRPDGVMFSVRDSGPGIPPEEVQLIFEPLYTTQTQSFGLGLAIAQRVVEMHGGYIEVESEPGKGSTFTIFLPRVAPESPTDGVAADAMV
jgi:signal transduction histidine kinase